MLPVSFILSISLSRIFVFAKINTLIPKATAAIKPNPKMITTVSITSNFTGSSSSSGGFTLPVSELDIVDDAAAVVSVDVEVEAEVEVEVEVDVEVDVDVEVEVEVDVDVDVEVVAESVVISLVDKSAPPVVISVVLDTPESPVVISLVEDMSDSPVVKEDVDVRTEMVDTESDVVAVVAVVDC